MKRHNHVVVARFGSFILGIRYLSLVSRRWQTLRQGCFRDMLFKSWKKCGRGWRGDRMGKATKTGHITLLCTTVNRRGSALLGLLGASVKLPPRGIPPRGLRKWGCCSLSVIGCPQGPSFSALSPVTVICKMVFSSEGDFVAFGSQAEVY